MTQLQITLIIVGSILVLGLIVSIILTMYIASQVYKGTLTRKDANHWGRTVSFPDNEEQVKIWDIGLEWAKNNKASMKEVSITSFDNLKLVGEYYDFGNNRSVIILPGRCESLCYSYYYAKPYQDAGYNVLVIDARAHGLSEGKYNTCGLNESKDIIQWANYLHDNFNQEKVSLHGICVGGGGALLAMTSKYASPYFDKLIVDGLFVSFKKIYSYHFKDQGHKLFPVYYEVWIWMKIKTGLSARKSNPLKVAKRLNNPVLFLYSKEDKYSISKKSMDLYNECSCEKQIHWFEHGIHSHVRFNNTEEYDQTVIDFVK